MLEADVWCYHCFCDRGASGECGVVEEMEGTSVGPTGNLLDSRFSMIELHLYEQTT